MQNSVYLIEFHFPSSAFKLIAVRSFNFFVVLTFAMWATHAAATKTSSEPGQEATLATGQGSFDLIVSGFYRGEDGYTGISLLWVPPFLKSVCRGRHARECQHIDHCIDNPSNDWCKNYDL